MLLAIFLSALLALHGLRKRSLSSSGATAAFVVGLVHFGSGLRFGGVMIFFYLTSSKLTKWRGELKRKLEADHVEGGQRSASQVLANSLGGALFALGTALVQGRGERPALFGSSGTGCTCSLPGGGSQLVAAFVAFYACCCADTWSSEVGIVSKAPPRLITTLKVVPPGTNGGVSLLGIAAAAGGGVLMGVSYFLLQLLDSSLGLAPCSPSACLADAALIPLALCAGVLGSLLDSLLGATLQYSGFDERSKKLTSVAPRGEAEQWVKRVCGRDVLSNTGVNVVASLLTSAAAAAGAGVLCRGRL
ncbi:hypothetical protein N2152v2_009022 [Parachlorella kessleri]